MPKYFLTIPKHLWKVEKNDIFNPKIVIITSLEGQDLTKNLKFGGHFTPLPWKTGTTKVKGLLQSFFIEKWEYCL